jgi:hypothetical protein
MVGIGVGVAVPDVDGVDGGQVVEDLPPSQWETINTTPRHNGICRRTTLSMATDGSEAMSYRPPWIHESGSGWI